jgi:hypothetical protein
MYILENSFRDIALRESDIELYEFNKAIQILEYIEMNPLEEGFLDNIMDKLSSGIKKKIDFIKEVAKIAGNNLKDLLQMFKDTRFFKIFQVIGFQIKKIINLFKLGIKTYNNIQNILAEKIASLGGVKYIKKNLHVLDDWFNEHPVMKKIGGVAVAGLLFYIWTQMSFTPDLEYSMDFKDIINGLMGNFSLGELFASPSGVTMLIYLASGMLLGLSAPWPGKQSTQIIGGLIFSSYRLIQSNGGFKKLKIKMPTK